MRAKLSRLTNWLDTALWFVPVLGVLSASGLATAINYLDWRLFEAHRTPFLLRDPDTAQSILSVIAASMLTFTALVFTITIVVVQQAGNQYSPRVIRHYLRDRLSKATLAVFLGTFAFSLETLAWMGASPPGERFVPAFSVLTAFGTVFVSLALFVSYLDGVAQSLRVGEIVDALAQETRRLLDPLPLLSDVKRAPSATEPIAAANAPAEPARLLAWMGRAGTLNDIDTDRLVHLARHGDCTLRLRPTVGDFVPEGSVVLELRGGAGALEDAELVQALGIGPERTMLQDLAFGFRQLVDIGEKALSPGINDPTTAVQVLDRLHDLLRQLGVRELPKSEFRDDHGVLRLSMRERGWADYLDLAVDEIRRYGKGSLQVARRLRALLEDLLSVVPPARRASVEDQLERLDESVRREFDTDRDLERARRADAQGLGD